MQALGLQVPAGATARVGATDPAIQGTGTVVSLGDWDVEWNSQGMLTRVFVPAPPSTAAKLTSAQAGGRVTQILTALVASLPAPDSLAYEDTAPDWVADWTRMIDGVAAQQDGTKVVLTPDGQFVSYWHAESSLAPKPAQPLTEAQATAKYPSCKDSSNGPNGKTETCFATQIWYRPASEANDQPLRLTWEIRYNWSDANQGRGGGVMYIDAGTGEIMGSAAID